MSKAQRFIDEVVAKGAEACLPSALSDEWLAAVARSAEVLMAGFDGWTMGSEKAEPPGAIVLAALICILRAKNADGEAIEVPDEQLQEYVKMYAMELSLEQIHRHTDIKYERASLDLILTDRDIATWKE